MPRLRRKLPPLRWLALASCACILAVWAISLVLEIVYIQPFSNWGAFIRVSNGQIGFYCQDAAFRPRPRFHWYTRPISFGSDWTWEVRVLSSKTWAVILPFWMILGAAAAFTALLWHNYWHRRLPGHCPHCGYDLTGNTTGTCPECGTPLPNTPAPRQPDSSPPASSNQNSSGEV